MPPRDAIAEAMAAEGGAPPEMSTEPDGDEQVPPDELAQAVYQALLRLPPDLAKQVCDAAAAHHGYGGADVPDIKSGEEMAEPLPEEQLQ